MFGVVFFLIINSQKDERQSICMSTFKLKVKKRRPQVTSTSRILYRLFSSQNERTVAASFDELKANNPRLLRMRSTELFSAFFNYETNFQWKLDNAKMTEESRNLFSGVSPHQSWIKSITMLQRARLFLSEDDLIWKFEKFVKLRFCSDSEKSENFRFLRPSLLEDNLKWKPNRR